MKIEWEDLHRLLESSNVPASRREVAQWSLGTLEKHLGRSWPARAVRLNGRLPLRLELIGGHTLALAEALEFALQLECLQAESGFGDVRNDIRRDAREARFLHASTQLRLAAQAQYLNLEIRLEPLTSGGSSPADLSIGESPNQIVIEARVLTEHKAGRRQRQDMEAVVDRLQFLGLDVNVWIGGELGRTPTDDEIAAIERWVRQASAVLSRGSQPGEFLASEIILRASSWDGQGEPLRSTMGSWDLWPRFIEAVNQKIGQMGNSGANWLYLVALTGLWRFTDWGRSDLEAKVVSLGEAMNATLVHDRPDGIIVASAPGLAPADLLRKTTRVDRGAGFRLPVPPLRARETVVIPLDSEPQFVDKSCALIEAEESWLSWALERAGLPSLAAMLDTAA